jgi:hypothetical protein
MEQGKPDRHQPFAEFDAKEWWAPRGTSLWRRAQWAENKKKADKAFKERAAANFERFLDESLTDEQKAYFAIFTDYQKDNFPMSTGEVIYAIAVHNCHCGKFGPYGYFHPSKYRGWFCEEHRPGE